MAERRNSRKRCCPIPSGALVLIPACAFREHFPPYVGFHPVSAIGRIALRCALFARTTISAHCRRWRESHLAQFRPSVSVIFCHRAQTHPNLREQTRRKRTRRSPGLSALNPAAQRPSLAVMIPSSDHRQIPLPPMLMLSGRLGCRHRAIICLWRQVWVRAIRRSAEQPVLVFFFPLVCGSRCLGTALEDDLSGQHI